LHHVVLDHWSRRHSVIHARDARAKLAVAILLLAAVATVPVRRYVDVAGFSALLAAATGLARLPLLGLAWRAALVLPFSVAFAVMSWLSGDPGRAASLLVKSYVSAFTVVLLLSTTAFPDIARAAEWFRLPRPVILLMQFVYRYLFVISEQAQHMWQASQCRGGARRAGRRRHFRAAAGALSVLFARSYERAEGIQRAMAARGFGGRFITLSRWRFGWADALFLAVSVMAIAGLRSFEVASWTR
jgi:cobalt/nickel transport system permease protein